MRSSERSEDVSSSASTVDRGRFNESNDSSNQRESSADRSSATPSPHGFSSVDIEAQRVGPIEARNVKSVDSNANDGNDADPLHTPLVEPDPPQRYYYVQPHGRYGWYPYYWGGGGLFCFFPFFLLFWLLLTPSRHRE